MPLHVQPASNKAQCWANDLIPFFKETICPSDAKLSILGPCCPRDLWLIQMWLDLLGMDCLPSLQCSSPHHYPRVCSTCTGSHIQQNKPMTKGDNSHITFMKMRIWATSQQIVRTWRLIVYTPLQEWIDCPNRSGAACLSGIASIALGKKSPTSCGGPHPPFDPRMSKNFNQPVPVS